MSVNRPRASKKAAPATTGERIPITTKTRHDKFVPAKGAMSEDVDDLVDSITDLIVKDFNRRNALEGKPPIKEG